MQLSPPMNSTSPGPYPGNSFMAPTSGSGARNHSAPRPLTRMANSRQLRLIAVTTLEPAIPCAASAVALDAAIDSRRKK